MARYQFVVGQSYAARRHAIHPRPIENSPTSKLSLLRLEFEVFTIFPSEKTVRSTGAIACRDLIIGPAVDVTRDSSVAMYAAALRLRDATKVTAWTADPREPVWVEIVFGETGKIDLRNEFQSVSPLSIAGWTIGEFAFDVADDWVMVSQAARTLKTSAATVRRRLRALEPEWGARLVIRTRGEHRRIHLPLLRNLWRERANSVRIR